MTIYTIAKITGYSSATVARALSGKGYVSKDAKEKILQAAEKVGYRPNIQAKSLRSNKTYKVLCCIPDICNPFYFKMIKGINDVLAKEGYLLILCSSDKEKEKEINLINELKGKFADGLIMISFDFNADLIEAIRGCGVPTVLGNRCLLQKNNDCFDYVYVDHVKGMEIATNHLLDRGCKNILLLTGDLSSQTSSERANGYFKALKERNISLDYSYLLNGNYEEEASYKVTIKALDEGKKIDGIVAANDLSALGIMRALRDRNIRVPEDIKVASFDNTDYAIAISPSLTSIDMKQYELGVNLAKLVLDRISGRKVVKNALLLPELIKRSST